MDRLWTIIKVTVAGLAAFWFGLPGAFKALMLLQTLDILTGMAAATQESDPKRRLSSTVGMRGIRRKGLAWAVVGVVYVLETYLAVEMQVSLWGFTPAAAVAAWFGLTEALSIVENAERSGVPIPAFVSNALAQQRRKFDGEGRK